MQVVRDGFLVDYRLFVAIVEREYRYIKLGSDYKFKFLRIKVRKSLRVRWWGFCLGALV